MKNSTVNKTTTVETAFHQFCQNITLPAATIKKIRQRYQRIVKQLNRDFWNQSDSVAHCLYVGSYGRELENLIKAAVLSGGFEIVNYEAHLMLTLKPKGIEPEAHCRFTYTKFFS